MKIIQLFLGKTLGTFEGPGTGSNDEDITIEATESATGKYVVIQLWKEPGTLNLFEVKVLCGTAGTSGKQQATSRQP